MKNVLLYLSNAYYAIINGAAIHLNGVLLPVYDGMSPSDEVGSYILISADRGAQQTGNKCTFQFQANMLVDVVIKNGDFGFVDSDTVANEIAPLINTFTHLQVDNFQIVNTQANFNNLQGLNPTEAIFRTLIRFQHNIFQNN